MRVTKSEHCRHSVPRSSAIRLVGVTAAALLLLSSPAARADVTWTLTGTGDWSIPSNWSGGAVPTSTDNADIYNGGTVTITTTGDACSNLYLDSTSANSSIQMTAGSLCVSTSAFVGYSRNGTFSQSGGTACMAPGIGNANGLYLGYNSGASGTYTLSGTGEWVGGCQYVGFNGTGTFSQSAGCNYVNESLCLGDNPGSLGSYHLSGGFFQPCGAAVGNHGTGVFTQSGGTDNCAGYLQLGCYAGGSGSYLLSGGACESVELDVGVSGAGTFTQVGGTNVIAAQMVLARNAGSSGVYNLNGGTLDMATNSVWWTGNAMFNFGGAMLELGDSFSTSMPITLTGSGGNGILNTRGYYVDFSGTIAGAGGLTKTNSGTAVLGGANTYTGDTLISGGTLQLTNANALQQSTLNTSGSGSLSFAGLTAATFGGLKGSGNLSVTNTAHAGVALTVGNNNANTNYTGGLSGSGSLTKTGAGVLILAGSNIYSGGTTVEAGMLEVDGSLANSGSVQVQSGGTLSGSGSVGKATIASGATIAPGSGAGHTLTVASLLLANNSTLDEVLGTGNGADSLLAIAGALTISSSVTVAITPGADWSPGLYTLATFGSLVDNSGGFAGWQVTGANPPNKCAFAFSADSHDVYLDVLTVPEPSALVLLGVTAIGLIGWAWRRRRSKR